ncbi:hypothetical protein C0Q70_05303 [Pomacea canaliculata]|uniref:Phosphoglycolate phosphatase n=2 Tax=Pomacea canaliculata TaxID=400727 RepID=A0A2T7PKU0_POMCA|nr:hypothetical protein C0Q70_05303 [Pomacea canaliculata]
MFRQPQRRRAMTRLVIPLEKTRLSGVKKCSKMACRLLDKSSAEELIHTTDNFLFDCDGVLWDGKGVIPGSPETIAKLKALGKRVFYVTNNSSKTRKEYVLQCQKFGFDATEEEFASTSYVSALYLKNLDFKDKVYVVGNPAMATELDACGIKYTGIGPDPLHGNLDDWLKMELDPQVKCVLVGFDSHLSYMKIMKAATYLQNPDCLFLATNEDTHLPVNNCPIRIPGTGTMVKAVAWPAQREPVVMGKPEPSMFEVLRKTHGLDPARTVMVGDRLNTDIGLAKVCGLKSLLVLTGVAKMSDLPKNNVEKSCGVGDCSELPDLYTSSLGNLGAFI